MNITNARLGSGWCMTERMLLTSRTVLHTSSMKRSWEALRHQCHTQGAARGSRVATLDPALGSKVKVSLLCQPLGDIKERKWQSSDRTAHLP